MPGPTLANARSGKIGDQNPDTILLPKLKSDSEKSIYHLFIDAPHRALKEEKGEKQREE